MGRDTNYKKDILVIDIESTCWEKSPPEGQESEIIEIGYSLLNPTTKTITGAGRVYIRPILSAVSEYCFNLTGITQDILEKEGFPIKMAFEILRHDLDSRHRLWASYGYYDKRMIDQTCKKYNIKSPLDNSHLNIKALAPLVFGWSKEVGLDKALMMINIPLEGRHHSGKDDAYNIAKLLGVILERMGV